MKLASILPPLPPLPVDQVPSAIRNPLLSGTLQNLSGIQFFQKFVPALIGLAFLIGVIVFLFMMLIGAIEWISSGGNKEQMESAKGKLGNALIGLFVLFSVFAIIKFIEVFFGGLSILTLDIGPIKIK